MIPKVEKDKNMDEGTFPPRVARLIRFVYPSSGPPPGKFSGIYEGEIRRVLEAIDAVYLTEGVSYNIKRHDAGCLMDFLDEVSIRLFGFDGTKEPKIDA